LIIELGSVPACLEIVETEISASRSWYPATVLPDLFHSGTAKIEEHLRQIERPNLPAQHRGRKQRR
jgi:hypothetical protein